MQFGCAGCDEMPSVQAQKSPQFQLAAKARYQRNMTDGVKFPYSLRRSPDCHPQISKETARIFLDAAACSRSIALFRKR